MPNDNETPPEATMALTSRRRTEEIKAALEARKVRAGDAPNLPEQHEMREQEWFAQQATHPKPEPRKATRGALRLTSTGWVIAGGWLILMAVFLFPPWLGVQQLAGEQDTSRSVGRYLIAAPPDSFLVRERLNTGLDIPPQLVQVFYFARIDYARWWTEMFVCLASTVSGVVLLRSLTRRSF